MKLTPILVAALCTPTAMLFADTDSKSSATRSAELAGEAQTLFLTSVRERMVINDTPQGPFGLSQDPNVTIMDDRDAWKPRVPPVALQTVLERMKVEVVIPRERSFYANGRWFRQGEEFPLLDGEREIPVRVESVEINVLKFRDLKTEETASLSLKILPRSLPGARDPKVVLPKGVQPASPEGRRGVPFRP